MKSAALLIAAGSLLRAQEAPAGFDLTVTVAASAFSSDQLSAAPRSSESVGAGVRALLYPTWKLSPHWAFTGAVQVRSRPYFQDDFATQGYGFKGDVLQASLNYSRIATNRSLVVRAGMLQSAFGSFLQRYDEMVNPMTQMPSTYGYYYKTVTTLGLAGVQLDATLGRADFRAQFTSSSPMNRRGIFDDGQYGNWAGGAGYTIRQGFRVGVSAFRGPYLDRHFAFYFPGEADPKVLPGSGYGIDVAWGHGHWNVYGELQKFQATYRAIPDFNLNAGYAEVRRVLTPRWYAATRVEYYHPGSFPGRQAYEIAAGLRLNEHQLMKFGYQIQQGAANVAAIQLVTNFDAISLARD